MGEKEKKGNEPWDSINKKRDHIEGPVYCSYNPRGWNEGRKYFTWPFDFTLMSFFSSFLSFSFLFFLKTIASPDFWQRKVACANVAYTKSWQNCSRLPSFRPLCPSFFQFFFFFSSTLTLFEILRPL